MRSSILVFMMLACPFVAHGAGQPLTLEAAVDLALNRAPQIAARQAATESAQSLSFTSTNDNNALFAVQPGVTPTGTSGVLFAAAAGCCDADRSAMVGASTSVPSANAIKRLADFMSGTP